MKRLFLVKLPTYSLNFIRLNSYFLTTPIFYVNASPHIGHLYTAVIADASHRFALMKGATSTIFSVGTDEHGTKIQQAAQAVGLPPDKYCQNITSKYLELFRKFGIGYTDFVHTSEERHRRVVHHIWNELISRNFIYKGNYSGWYCESDESFLSEDQLTSVLKDGKEMRVSGESGRPVQWMEEENYRFDLARFKDDLVHWIGSGNAVIPDIFEKLLLHWITKEGLADGSVSVSRPVSRVHWGTSVPGDPSQTVYVWLDALANYLTVAGYPNLEAWPPDKQIIGKDILKFHGIYWPAFLFACGLEPPRQLVVHSHWTVDSEKMSKSRGNVVCPHEAAGRYTVEGLRYFLLREATPHSDSNYSETKVLRVLNSELADSLGNLLSRCCSSTVNKMQHYPAFVEEHFSKYCRESFKTLILSLETLADEVNEHYSEFNFYRGISTVILTIHEANRCFEVSRPWELRKSPLSQDHLSAVLHLTMETLRLCGLCLLPVIPSLGSRLLDKLCVPRSARGWSDIVPSWKSDLPSKPSVDLKKELNQEKLILYRRLVASS